MREKCWKPWKTGPVWTQWVCLEEGQKSNNLRIRVIWLITRGVYYWVCFPWNSQKSCFWQQLISRSMLVCNYTVTCCCGKQSVGKCTISALTECILTACSGEAYRYSEACLQPEVKVRCNCSLSEKVKHSNSTCTCRLTKSMIEFFFLQVVTGEPFSEICKNAIEYIRFPLLDPEELSVIEKENEKKHYIPVRCPLLALGVVKKYEMKKRRHY